MAYERMQSVVLALLGPKAASLFKKGIDKKVKPATDVTEFEEAYVLRWALAFKGFTK